MWALFSFSCLNTLMSGSSSSPEAFILLVVLKVVAVSIAERGDHDDEVDGSKEDEVFVLEFP
jgi:hypothetical protein